MYFAAVDVCITITIENLILLLKIKLNQQTTFTSEKGLVSTV